jgi:ATP-dependent DNA helicase PIF1
MLSRVQDALSDEANADANANANANANAAANVNADAAANVNADAWQSKEDEEDVTDAAASPSINLDAFRYAKPSAAETPTTSVSSVKFTEYFRRTTPTPTPAPKTPTVKSAGKRANPFAAPVESETSEVNPEEKKRSLHSQLRALSNGQQRVLDAVLAGKSICLTGVAGSGKSYLLEQIIAALPEETTAITASTGVAAVAVGGLTVHSFAGIGLGDGEISAMIRKVRFNQVARERWKTTKVLLIDEISMLSAGFFETLEKVARAVRLRKSEPFGGLQLVLCGDFLQLPPIVKNKKADIFAFQAPCWDSCVSETIMLDRVFRQTDGAFVRMLNEIRLGHVSEEAERLLEGCVDREIDVSDGIVPTKLRATKSEVARDNRTELAKLPGKLTEFDAVDKGSKSARMALDRNVSAPLKLGLKVGAQVMLLTNLDVEQGLCNGSVGVIVEFTRDTKYCALVKTDGGHKKQKREQRTLDSFTRYAPTVFPVVRFETGAKVAIQPHAFEVSSEGRVVASRTQIPLNLAWAITIHKSQGQTLSKLVISLANCFEFGQVYVALSRARSLEGLCLTDFNSVKVKAHPIALAFYRRIKEVAENKFVEI